MRIMIKGGVWKNTEVSSCRVSQNLIAPRNLHVLAVALLPPAHLVAEVEQPQKSNQGRSSQSQLIPALAPSPDRELFCPINMCWTHSCFLGAQTPFRSSRRRIPVDKLITSKRLWCGTGRDLEGSRDEVWPQPVGTYIFPASAQVSKAVQGMKLLAAPEFCELYA